jgi:hypothetical protein
MRGFTDMQADVMEQKSPEMVLAETRLAEAEAQSAEIQAKIDGLRTIRARLNEQLGKVDVPWQRRQFVESHLGDYERWARGDGKLPSARSLAAIDEDLAALRVAYDHFGLRLVALDAAQKLSMSEELVNRARIATLQSHAENLAAARALASIRGTLGDASEITVAGGKSQELEERADFYAIQAAQLRRDAETRMRELEAMQPTRKGTNGR